MSGRVHVGGMGLPGVTVTLTGEEGREGNTDADGQYAFAGLAAGDYTLTISGWDEVEYHFEPTMEITLELDETRTGQNFAGRALRTATVMGYVTVEGDGPSRYSVTLIKVETANSGEILGAMPTGDDGGYSFGPLLAGAYRVIDRRVRRRARLRGRRSDDRRRDRRHGDGRLRGDDHPHGRREREGGGRGRGVGGRRGDAHRRPCARRQLDG